MNEDFGKTYDSFLEERYENHTYTRDYPEEYDELPAWLDESLEEITYWIDELTSENKTNVEIKRICCAECTLREEGCCSYCEVHQLKEESMNNE